MKKVLGIVALLLATALPALAGERRDCDPQGTDQVLQRFQVVQDRLSLTQAQADQVRPLLAGVLLSVKAVRDDYSVADQSSRNRRRMAREIRAIRSHADKRLKLILSNAQMEELRAIRNEWRDQIPTWAVLEIR